MKTNLFILGLLVFSSFVVNAQEIKWMTLEEAVAAQKKKPKKIIMDAYTNWCGPCKMLDKNTFHNKDVVAYINENYYAVKFNAEGNETINFKGKTFTNPSYNPANENRRNSQHQLSQYFSIRSYPTMLFLDENGEFLSPIIGYKTPQQLELYLKLFKNNDHLKMKSQEDFTAYYEAFEPEFSN